MRKLWETSQGLDLEAEAYTVGDDPSLDVRLLPYEVYGSLAHAAGLVKIGILTREEFKGIRVQLSKLFARSGSISIERSQEDIHTLTEQYLVKALGDVGAKVHAGRSRNDQVQADLRLYLKDSLLRVMALSCEAAGAWESFGKRWEKTAMPGYTHLQKAMPTTVGHWAASHAEALLENIPALRAAFEEADASPLGSAAGYGVPLELDRAFVARLLGFSRVQRNTLRVQSSRPRVEASAVSALALLARDLGCLAWDLSLFMTAEFGFLSLEGSFTTGSSLMPQKKNPDVIELTRARAALFPGWLHQILSVGLLPSGYHRDYQLTKGILFRAFDEAEAMLKMFRRVPGSLRVHAERCAAAVTEDLTATGRAVALVKQGMPFRHAYRETAEIARNRQGPPAVVKNPELPRYSGSPGNPDWKAIRADRVRETRRIQKTARSLHSRWASLLKLSVIP